MMKTREHWVRGFIASKKGKAMITLPNGTQEKGNWENGKLTSLKDQGCWYFGVQSTDYMIPCTIAEWIGRLDKNNKFVYEGDIIIYTFVLPDRKTPGIIYMLVVWDDKTCGYKLKEIGNDVTMLDEIPSQEEFVDIEVIGNRWENPELLEALR